MGTRLQVVYDSFASKVDEDLFEKEALIFQWFVSAVSKCKKFAIHSLNYVLEASNIPGVEDYDGYFIEELDTDEVELIALQMKYESYDRKNAYLVSLKQAVGTRDFNSLPNKKQELDGIQNSMRLLKSDISEVKQQLNTYKY